MDTTNVAYTNIKAKKTLIDAKSYADAQIQEAVDPVTSQLAAITNTLTVENETWEVT